MKIYIAGPITGIPEYRETFGAAADKLAAEGHTVLNPATLPDGLEYAEYMDIGMAMLRCCDAIHILPGWKESGGAVKEVRAAASAGKVIMGDIAVRDILTLAKYAQAAGGEAEG